ncbi:MAG: ribosomal protein S18-alanine N-acetyltransferase [Pyrinomonadaceae bacterium]
MSRGKPAREVGRAAITLQRMTEHDLLEVVEIEEASGLSCWGWDAYFAELSRARESIMLIARFDSAARDVEANNQRLAGFIAARIGAGELHVNNIAVREAYRRRGVGAALLERVLEDGRREGALRALLEVRASNLRAQSLYLRQGFKATARRRHYYTSPPDDALIMVAEF